MWLRRFVFQTNTLLHIFQLEGYRNKRFARWLIKNPKRAFDSESFVSGAIIFFIGLFLESFNLRIIFLILWIGSGIWLFKRCKRKKQKKPFVWTVRAKRLIVFSILIPLIPLSVIAFFTSSLFLLYFLILQIFIQIAGINLILTNIFLFPIEKGFNLFYLIKARNKMKKLMPMVIGITGSYGKTSVKHIIGHILSKKYKTLITKESYNTLMGVCKVINNELKDEEVFVVEMGAYKRGDIRKLCKLVRPKIGVLTGIGIQHLERFKTIENIKKAKFEIILSLPPSGIAIVNNDDEVCKGLMNEVKIKKVGYRMSLESGVRSLKSEGIIMAEDVEMDVSGIKFRVGETMFQTGLLGRHNVSNILAGIAVAKELGIEIKKIKEAIEELSFIPHRLQLIRNPNNVFVLDDSYNSNPVGVDEALSCLSLFKGRKILVTPGMIELGIKEYEENKKFGKKAADVCDIVILVGEKRTKPIFDGLMEKRFQEKNIIIVHSLEMAQKELEKIIKPGDCILFENDLPDTYEE